MPGFAPPGGAPLGAPLFSGFGGAFDLDAVIEDGLGMHLATIVTQVATIHEGVRFELLQAANRGVPVTLASGVGLASTLTAYYGLVVVERLRFTNPIIANQISRMLLTSGIGVHDTINNSVPVVLTDTVGIALSQSVQRAVTVAETLRIGSTLTGNGLYHMTLTQALRLTDHLLRYLGVSVSEALGVGSTLTAAGYRAAAITETVGIGATLTPLFLLTVTAAENVRLTDTDVVKMLYHPTLRDGIEITAAHVAPDGSFTTWVMNTRSGAVTEYADFSFNSFARVGNRYLAASDTGLYELLGDTDDGDDIIARIKSGFLQFGGTHLSRLKAAYVAMRGEGEIVLKIETADGLVYHYETSMRNMRSTKVHMGKGQRSRYFAFELITTGQDFDLDTLEFVPIVVERRV